MKQDRSTATTVLVSLLAAGVYPLFLVLSTLYVLPLSLWNQLFADRCTSLASVRSRVIHRSRWFVLIDVIATIVTYIVADLFRCGLWMGCGWPENVPGHGSTQNIHLLMLGFLVFAWPSILYWLGWYRPRRRTITWRMRNTVAAAGILTLLMSAVALASFREIYPRAQIGLMVGLLPIITAVIRLIVESLEQFVTRRHRDPNRLDPAW
ncbi:MAG: hypothetical protein KF841_05865 [Phycisphaerae bacterium]|nr:hypothetical protein [Phycisphaerae bacterium]